MIPQPSWIRWGAPLAVVFCLAVLLVLVLRGRNHSGDGLPAVELPILRTVLLTDRTCESPSVLSLRTEHRIHRVSSSTEVVEPRCYHVGGWSGRAAKCVVEYGTVAPRGYRAEGLGSRLASSYYEHFQTGVLFFSSPDREGIFVMLDHRWCDLFGSAEGIAVVS